jgi:hypothetical protein
MAKIANKIELAARVAHEVNRVYCESLNDHTQPTWDDAPDWQQRSAVAGAKTIQLDPSTTPEDSHKSWMALKVQEGWKHGPVKDVEKKLHPCMVPYEKLPPQQRIKDQLFTTVVKTILFAE